MTLKASRISFSPDTPHQAVWHKPPNNYITMTPEIACPTIQQIHYPLRHHPTNTKQAKYHTPHLISYRTVKEEMIYRFPRTTKCLFRRLSIVRILPKAAVQEKKSTFDCHTIFQGKEMRVEAEIE